MPLTPIKCINALSVTKTPSYCNFNHIKREQTFCCKEGENIQQTQNESRWFLDPKCSYILYSSFTLSWLTYIVKSAIEMYVNRIEYSWSNAICVCNAVLFERMIYEPQFSAQTCCLLVVFSLMNDKTNRWENYYILTHDRK